MAQEKTRKSKVDRNAEALKLAAKLKDLIKAYIAASKGLSALEDYQQSSFATQALQLANLTF